VAQGLQFADDAEAVALIQRQVALVGGFKVSRHASGVRARQDLAQQLGAQTLALPAAAGAEVAEVPVRRGLPGVQAFDLQLRAQRAEQTAAKGQPVRHRLQDDLAERHRPGPRRGPQRSGRGVAGEVTRFTPPQVTAAHAGEERAHAVVPVTQLRRDQPGEDRVLGKGVGEQLAEHGCLIAAGGADGLGVSAVVGYRWLPLSARPLLHVQKI